MAKASATMATRGSGIAGVTVSPGTHGELLPSKSGGPQLEIDDLLLAISPRVLSRYEGFMDAVAAASVQYDVDETQTQALRTANADDKFALAQAEKLPNNTTAIERAARAVAKSTAKLDAHQAKRKARPGNPGNYISNFVNSRQEFGNFTWCEPVVPMPEDETAQGHDDLRTERAKLLMQRKVIERAPVTRDKIEARVRDTLRAWRDGGSLNVKPITKMAKGESGRAYQGNVALPMLPTIVGQNGFMIELPDMLAIMAEVFAPQLEKHLIEKALEDFEPEEALQDSERRDQLAAVDAQIDMIERQGELLFCKLRDQGIAVERWCIRPEVLLGIAKVST